jgi:hypothetical protein
MLDPNLVVASHVQQTHAVERGGRVSHGFFSVTRRAR